MLVLSFTYIEWKVRVHLMLSSSKIQSWHFYVHMYHISRVLECYHVFDRFCVSYDAESGISIRVWHRSLVFCALQLNGFPRRQNKNDPMSEPIPHRLSEHVLNMHVLSDAVSIPLQADVLNCLVDVWGNFRLSYFLRASRKSILFQSCTTPNPAENICLDLNVIAIILYSGGLRSVLELLPERFSSINHDTSK